MFELFVPQARLGALRMLLERIFSLRREIDPGLPFPFSVRNEVGAAG